MMAALAKRENGPLGCLLLNIILAVLSGYAPRLATVKGWQLSWLWYMFPGVSCLKLTPCFSVIHANIRHLKTWYIEAFFTKHTLPFSYLYDINATEVYTGYTTGRTNFDIG